MAVTTLVNGYDFAGGTATLVVACLGILLVIGVALGLFRLLTSAGWRRWEHR
ncbi:hypothetical protein AB0878_25505 [Amycolatopsis sp. NPDC047767]|uniref:hypothetical protein n=1 Tax=Amycolatopsis sp. NPDC047767 TaxID=3156765 RepID=UPI0034572D9C